MTALILIMLALQPTTLPVDSGAREVQAHDPSTVVREGDVWHVFATDRGVSHFSSLDLTTWTPQPRVFRRPLPWLTDVAASQKGHLWAPDVVRVGERWLLYYSVSAFGKQTSALALATSPTLDNAAWKDEGIVLQSREGDPYNAIDPALLYDDGRLWLAFGSFWRGLYLMELDPATGKRLNDDPPKRIARHPERNPNAIEAPALVRRGAWYYLFVNWGICCRGVESTYEARVGRSARPDGPFVDKAGVRLDEGGGTFVLGTEGAFVGPGHVGVGADARGEPFVSVHFYDATREGKPRLAIRPLVWTADGWPEIR